MFSSELKKELECKYKALSFVKYHLLDSVLHLINTANYNKHPNKTNKFLLQDTRMKKKKKKIVVGYC